MIIDMGGIKLPVHPHMYVSLKYMKFERKFYFVIIISKFLGKERVGITQKSPKSKTEGRKNKGCVYFVTTKNCSSKTFGSGPCVRGGVVGTVNRQARDLSYQSPGFRRCR